MKDIIKTICLATAAILAVSCDNPKPQPNAPVTLGDNSMIYDNSKIDFSSVVIDNLTDPYNTIVYASAESGITTAAEMTKKAGNTYAHSFISVAIPTTQINKTIDVKSTATFLILNNTALCTEVNRLETGITDHISSGTIKFTAANVAGGPIKAEFEITVAQTGEKFQWTAQGTLSAQPVIKANNISFDGTETLDFKSVIFDASLDPNRLFVLASPNAGVTTYAEMMKEEAGVFVNRPLMTFIAYTAMNGTYNVMTESAVIYGAANNTGVGSEIKSIMNGMFADVSAGIFVSSYSQTTGDISITLNLTAKKSGKKLYANINGIFAKPVPEPVDNYMKLDKEISAIKSKFHQADSRGIALWVSPAVVDGTKINQSGHYARIWVDRSEFGKSLDITDAAAKFEIFYQNLTKLDENINISPNKFGKAKGTVKIVEGAQKSYSVDLQLSIGDTTITIKADDITKDIGNTNLYTIIGNPDVTTFINSAIVDKTADSGNFWDIYLSDKVGITTVAEMKASGNPVVIRTKQAWLTSKQISFSTQAEASITYGGVKYDSSNGSDGNFKCTLDGTTLSLTEFFAMKNAFMMEGKFVGPVVTVVQ